MTIRIDSDHYPFNRPGTRWPPRWWPALRGALATVGACTIFWVAVGAVLHLLGVLL